MINKSQSISVRLSEEDYNYLMRIEQNGAVTQSDKVRELIAMARESVGTESFARSFITATQSVTPYRARYKDSGDDRSSLIDAVLDFLTESVAYIQAQPPRASASELESKLLPVSTEFIRRILPLMLEGQGGFVSNSKMAARMAKSLRSDIKKMQSN